jgi:hypothetical protein
MMTEGISVVNRRTRSIPPEPTPPDQHRSDRRLGWPCDRSSERSGDDGQHEGPEMRGFLSALGSSPVRPDLAVYSPARTTEVSAVPQTTARSIACFCEGKGMVRGVMAWDVWRPMLIVQPSIRGTFHAIRGRRTAGGAPCSTARDSREETRGPS